MFDHLWVELVVVQVVVTAEQEVSDGSKRT